MQYGHEAFIIAIDNRATQIAKDTHIAICQREDYSPLLRWLDGKKIFSECLNIHSKEIKLWKNQFC
jgi:formylmethanofuran dehydrogenase subunit B